MKKETKSMTYEFADSVSAALSKVTDRVKDPFKRLSHEDQERLDAAEAKRQRRAEKRK